jgi:hypothetical protein
MLPRLERFLMLMDVYNLKEECIVSCSANAEVLRDVEKGALFIDECPDPYEEFSWSMFLDTQKLVNNFEQSEAPLEKFASEDGNFNLRLFWRFIRKADMVLLDVPSLEAAPVVLIKHFNKDGDMDFPLHLYMGYN